MQSMRLILLFCLSCLFASPAVPASGTVIISYRKTVSRCIVKSGRNSSYRVSLQWTVIGPLEKVENFNSNIYCEGESDSELSYNPILIPSLATSSAQHKQVKDSSNSSGD